MAAKPLQRKRTTNERESYLEGWLKAAEHFANNWEPNSRRSRAFSNTIVSGVCDELKKMRERRRRISGRRKG